MNIYSINTCFMLACVCVTIGSYHYVTTTCYRCTDTTTRCEYVQVMRTGITVKYHSEIFFHTTKSLLANQNAYIYNKYLVFEIII